MDVLGTPGPDGSHVPGPIAGARALLRHIYMSRIAVRWTVGDVSPWGYEALALSIAGALRTFGPSSHYVVCVNTLPLEQAASRLGDVAARVALLSVTRDRVPRFLLDRFDDALAEGVGWKLAPPRVFPECYELSLDNDCVLWDVPRPLARARREGRPLLAEDVRTCLGTFAPLCSGAPRNSGIRGLPPRFDLERELRRTLGELDGTLRSELDEQGLQVATMERWSCDVVSLQEVSVCSPFPPHLPTLGRAGAHLVGLNAKTLPWEKDGRPAHELTREHFERLRGAVAARVRGDERP